MRARTSQPYVVQEERVQEVSNDHGIDLKDLAPTDIVTELENQEVRVKDLLNGTKLPMYIYPKLDTGRLLYVLKQNNGKVTIEDLLNVRLLGITMSRYPRSDRIDISQCLDRPTVIKLLQQLARSVKHYGKGEVVERIES